MRIQNRTKAISYIHVATESEAEANAHLERHKLTVWRYCDKGGLSLTYSFVDIGAGCSTARRQGRIAALAALASGRAGVLVVPCLTQLSRSVSEVVDITARNFGASASSTSQNALIAVADGIDTRTDHGRFGLDVLHCLARFSMGREHA